MWKKQIGLILISLSSLFFLILFIWVFRLDSKFDTVIQEVNQLKNSFALLQSDFKKFIEKAEKDKEMEKKIVKENEFDIEEAKVGDIIAGWVIESIEPYNPKLFPQFSLRENSKIKFKGKTSLSGVYHYYGSDYIGYLKNTVCFDNLDTFSILKVPQMAGRKIPVWFCFSNQELAKKWFGPPGSTGIATIVIDYYEMNTYPSEVWDIARLVDVWGKN
ncbi:MAG: hypothetical protein HY602_02870 [Parcubacteria group bacterium]|nr:hypothetical protein [Parcubacteria group bacterium]